MYYYANTFKFYKIKEGKRISYHYTACRLYKSEEEAKKNSWNQWLQLADDGEILESTYIKTMWI